jgi:hypothetical protein
MTQKRPINADMPASVPKRRPESPPAATPGTAAEKASAKETDGPAAAGSGRRPIPGALKAIGALVAIAIVILVVAVAGGGSESQSGQRAGSAGSGESSVTGTTATNNTTRISADDTATFAANVALTVFPSETPAQRPKSVALVGDESWQNAVAAAALMAHPIRAPLLISSASELPDPTVLALQSLQPHGNLLKKSGNLSRKGVPYYVIGPIPTPSVPGFPGRTAKTGPLNGAPQAAEIEAFRKTIFRAPPPHVIVAPENDPAFAVPAAAWAARSGDDVLYTRKDELPPATIKALKRFPTPSVYVLGPPSAVSPAVLREIDKVDKGATRVRRVSGKTPAENAVALARYSDGSFGWNVNDPGHGFVIARSNNPLETALAAPLSASGTWGPLLLTESADKLPKAVREYLLDVKPGYTTDPTRAFYNHVWIVGDEGEIDAHQQAEINQLAELTKVRGEG